MSDATAELQPGLNQELWDSSVAFVDWCNEQGGINGRKIELTKLESKLFDAQQVAIAACESEFMLVGGGAAFDDQVVPERLKCGLPAVPAYNATKVATEAELNFPPLPTPFDVLAAGEAFHLAEEYPEAVKKAGSLAPNFVSAKNIAIRAKAAYTAAGWEFIDDELYNPAGEANWTGIVTSLKSAGVEALFYTGTYEPMVAFLKAAAEQNWKPQLIIGTSTIYNDSFLTEAGADADGTYSYTNIAPFDEAEPGSATAKYIEILDTYANAKPALMGADSMSAWLLWATAAKACGSDLTRQCVEDQILSTTEWTAGGLHAPSNPSKGNAGQPSCYLIVEASGSEWKRSYPESGFDCNEKYLVSTAAAPYE